MVYGIMLEVARPIRRAIQTGAGDAGTTIWKTNDAALRRRSFESERADVAPASAYYRLTGLGLRVLSTEVARLDGLSGS